MPHLNSPVNRSLYILELILKSQKPLTFKEIDALVDDVPSATVRRICSSLCCLDYLYKDSSTKTYRIDSRAILFAQLVMANQVHSAYRKSILQSLVNQINETSNIAVLNGSQLEYSDRIETNWPFRITLNMGQSLPLHCTASGKLFLSYMRKSQRETILNQMNLEQFTANTIINKEELLSHLKSVRKQKFAVNNEELIQGMVAISVPIIDENKNIFACLSVQAPTNRKSLETLKTYKNVLLDSAKLIAKTHIRDFKEIQQDKKLLNSYFHFNKAYAK